ncbi:PAS domain S-box protein [bacterium]|nr:PAS domain S-box protein [bacterium]
MISLLDQNPLLRNLLDQANIGIFLINEQSTFSFVNKQITQKLNVPEHELIGTDPALIIHPEERDRISQAMAKRLSGDSDSASFHTRVSAKDGRTIDIALDVSTVRDNDNNVRGIIGFVRDISVQVNAQRERLLFENQALLIEKLAGIGRLATTVVHQINNPLEAIKNYIYLIREEFSDHDQAKEMLNHIENEVFRIAQLTRQIVDFAGPTAPHFLNYNINHLLEDIIFLMDKEIRTHNVVLKTQFENAIPPVKLLPDQMKQALINILFNALEAMPNGGNLEIQTEKIENGVEVRITDSGTGIAKVHIMKIFDPFFSTKDSRKFIGLGLSVSLHIINRHEGHIRVESEVDRGTSIIISLPAAEQPTATIA